MSKKFYLDLLERTCWTFVQAFGAVWIVTASFDRLSLKVAAMAGGIAAVKGVVASRIGDPNSASTVPAVTNP